MLAALLRDARGLLLDLNGVFFEDDRSLPGSRAALTALGSSSLPRRFATNTTTKTRAELAASLAAMGLPIAENELVTPLQAAVHHLRSMGKPRVHLVLRDNLKSEFAEFDQEHTHPDAIVIGDIGERWNYPIMNQLFAMTMFGAKIIALHKGRYWQRDNALRLDIGAFVAGLEYASGHSATVIGKPSASFYAMAASELGCSPQNVIMFGDDIQSDIQGAQDAGMRAVLVRTGKYRDELLRSSKISPDAIIDSVGDLAEQLT